DAIAPATENEASSMRLGGWIKDVVALFTDLFNGFWSKDEKQDQDDRRQGRRSASCYQALAISIKYQQEGMQRNQAAGLREPAARVHRLLKRPAQKLLFLLGRSLAPKY